MDPDRPLRAVIGVTTFTATPARVVATGAARAGGAAWRGLVPRPARRPFVALLDAAERRGSRDTMRLRAAAADAAGALLDSSAGRDAVRRMGASTLVLEALDEAFAGPLADELAERLVTYEILERVTARLLEGETLERLVGGTLGSAFTQSATDQLLASDELRRIVAQVARSEDVRAALQDQSLGLATEVAGGVRERTVGVDETLERSARRLLRRRRRSAPVIDVDDEALVDGAPGESGR
jgi:hypothetical protein